MSKKILKEQTLKDAITTIQNNLIASGYKIEPDGIFGPETAAAVLGKISAKTNTVANPEFDQLVAICTNLYKVLDKEPELYFKKFKGLLNDNEIAAQKWFTSAWKKAWGPTMDKLLKSTNATIRTNATNIKTMVDQFIKYIGEEHIGASSVSGYTYTLILKHPTDPKQNTTVKIRYDYM